MIKKIVVFALGLVSAKPIILSPPTDKGEPMAVVWVQGAECKAESYKGIAEEFQKQAAEAR